MSRTPKKKLSEDDLAAHLTPEPNTSIPEEPVQEDHYPDDADFADPNDFVGEDDTSGTLAGFSFDDDALFAESDEAGQDLSDAEPSPTDFDFDNLGEPAADAVAEPQYDVPEPVEGDEPEITLMAAVPEMIGNMGIAAGAAASSVGDFDEADESVQYEEPQAIEMLDEPEMSEPPVVEAAEEPTPQPRMAAAKPAEASQADLSRFEAMGESSIAIAATAETQSRIELPPDLQNSEPAFDRPVPRVSIQAFCDTPANGMVIQKAAEDRRLSKAHVTVHMGGMQGAVEYFQDTPTPNLIFIELSRDTSDVFNQLASLAEVCDPGTKVVLIGQYNDITLYRALIRQGVSEYLVPPLNVAQVIDTIASLFIDPEAPPIGRCVSVIGAKGGVGASVIAHNVAWLIAEEMMEDTTLVDFDLYFGTGGLDFNQDPVQGVADALNAPERLDDQLLERLLVKCTERLSLFSSPAAIDREFGLEPEAFESVLETVRSSVPVMIVDLPHLWEAWTRRVLLSSDEIVLVSSPDLASLRNTKNMVELLKSARPNDADPKLVMNNVGMPKRPEIPVKDFAEAVGLEPVLIVPFDPQLFGAAANNGQMIAEMKPEHKASTGLRQLAGMLSTREIEEPVISPIQKFLNSLLGKS